MNIFQFVIDMIGGTISDYPFLVAWVSALVLCIAFLNLYYIFVALFKFIGRW